MNVTLKGLLKHKLDKARVYASYKTLTILYEQATFYEDLVEEYKDLWKKMAIRRIAPAKVNKRGFKSRSALQRGSNSKPRQTTAKYKSVFDNIHADWGIQ